MKTSSQRIKSLTPSLVAIGFAFCISSGAAESLETLYGNTITGKIQSLEQDIITIQSPLSEQAITVKTSSLKHLETSSPNKPHPNHSEVLTLINGDQLPCKILPSDESIINVSTWYAGEMSIDRSKVAAIRFGLTAENTIFTGYKPPKEWSVMSGKWAMTDDHKYQGTGHLAQLVDYPDKARIRFDLQWDNTPNFAFRFFAEKDSASSKQNTYECIFNSEGLEIRRYLNAKDSAARLGSIDAPEIKKLQKENTMLNIDLRIDKNEGLVSLYLDSNFIGTWEDTLGSVNGNYVIFDNRSKQSANCVISNLAISSLKGDIKPRFYDPNAKSFETDILTDDEGEYIHGEILSIEENDIAETAKRTILIERRDSKSTERIPEHRVSQILFKQNPAQQPTSKMSYTLSLKNDGILKANELKISGEEITISHPLLGSVRLSRSALESLSSSADTLLDHEQNKLAQVILLNGDKILGNIQSSKDERMTISAPYLNEAVVLHTSKILSIQMERGGHIILPDTYSRIKVHQRHQESKGDTVIGRLEELTADSIKINTPYSESLTLRRSMIKSLNIISKQQGQYFGPNNIEEWETSDEAILAKPSAWQFKEGSLKCYSQNAESIGKEIGLRNKSHVSFDVSWQDSLGFSLQLYSSDPRSRQPSACYLFKFDKYAVMMMTRSEGREQGHRRQRFDIKVRPKTPLTRFDIYINRETGTANIHIDGQEACIIQSPIPGPQDLGTALSFVSHPARSTTISNISISPWHSFATKNLRLKSKASESKDKHPHNIILINGDSIPCNVGTIKNDRMLVNTEHTPIKIPIKKIKSINWQDKREEPKKYSGDVRAWFNTGGFITLKLTSIEDGKLRGYSQATGDAAFDTKAFSRIDFNIYNMKANEMRTKHLFD